MNTFTATTKSGIKLDVTGHTTKQVATKAARLWVIALNAKEAQNELGISLPAGQKEALVVVDDQKGYEAFVRETERLEYEAKQAKKLETLEGQREVLASADYNTYSPDDFPGSKRYNEHQKAEKALREFDAAHPEIKAALQAKKDAETAERMKDVNIWNL